ncbi:hypothetical protein KAJ27_10400 [bacterium]|nr:hypothetical protein [bacterium]
MSFKPVYIDGEVVENDIDIISSRNEKLRLILTNKAAYWPAEKIFAVSDPVIAVKSDHNEIKGIDIFQENFQIGFIFGKLLVFIGFIWLVAGWIYLGFPDNHLVILPTSIFISVGALFVVKNQDKIEITIECDKGNLSWSGPFFGKIKSAEIVKVIDILRTWSNKYSISYTEDLEYTI